MSQIDQKYIYIVISKTDTLLGRTIQKSLGVNYNHCSISLDESLEKIYSFGRKELRNFFRAGFVQESKSEGFFKKYDNSVISVFKVAVTDLQWNKLNEMITQFKEESHLYKYSLFGLICCYFSVPACWQYKYFCSQFVAELLEQSEIYCFQKPSSLVRPHDFFELSQDQIIYKGKIGKYCCA